MDNKKENKNKEYIEENPIEIEEYEVNTGNIIRYERVKFLGKGGFAKCYELKRKDNGRVFAAKIIEKINLSNNRKKKKLINEIKIHKKLNNQNIVGFEKFFEDKNNVYILLELCSNQTLNDLVRRRTRLNELEVQCYILQIVRALKYLHNHRIIHRDLKLGNLFLTSKMELKLGDFGLSAKLKYDGQRRKTVCGTPNYIAPEILEKKNGHSYEVDIWSLGVCIFTMLYGINPFNANDEKIICQKIKMNDYKFPDDIKVDISAKKLISSLLNKDPSKRPSLDAIIEHDFFKKYHSIPLILPLYTLSCPLSQKYIAEFLKSENISAINSHEVSMIKNTLEKEKDMIDIDNRLGLNLDVDNEDNYNISKQIKSNKNKKSMQIPPEKRVFMYKISKYFDYSTKFGLVFFINCSHFGICFNDFSNIIKFCSDDINVQNTYTYYDTDGIEDSTLTEEELKKYLKDMNIDKEMAKKYEIFQKIYYKHFSDFKQLRESEKGDLYPYSSENNFYVKKFLISKNGTFFRLSNKVIQIFFIDNTELNLSTESTKFLYINQGEKEINRDISEAINGTDKDLCNKIQLAKNILIYFVKLQKSKKVPK